MFELKTHLAILINKFFNWHIKFNLSYYYLGLFGSSVLIAEIGDDDVRRVVELVGICMLWLINKRQLLIYYTFPVLILSMIFMDHECFYRTSHNYFKNQLIIIYFSKPINVLFKDIICCFYYQFFVARILLQIERKPIN